MSWLIVTPARNESERLPGLAASLAAQAPGLVGLWVVVDDGSTDGTAGVATSLDLPFPVHVLTRDNSGGLGRASEFDAFRAGADEGLTRLPDAVRVMKVDADLRLAPDHLARLAEVPLDVGLCGGRLTGLAEVEQSTYVLGGLKAYSRAAYDVVRGLPSALGWDVADEVAIRLAGMEVRVVPGATATTSRRTGASEGLLEGRRRNGVLSRWLGYHPLYFALRVVRFVFRKPFGLSAVALVRGYVSAGPSPYPPELRAAFRAAQVAKLRALARNPVRFLRETYGPAR